jgi:putative transposase
LRVPQERQGRFRTEVFERYQRSEKPLVSALTEMYIQGLSTRKVKAVTEELCGHEFSASTISRLNQNLDEELDQFAERQMGGCPRNCVNVLRITIGEQDEKTEAGKADQR